MSSGQQACYDDEQELDCAMKALGVDKVKLFSSVSVYSAEADVVLKAWRTKLSADDTIRALIRDKHARMAEQELREYFEAREKFKELSQRF